MKANLGRLQRHSSKMNLKINLIFKTLPSFILALPGMILSIQPEPQGGAEIETMLTVPSITPPPIPAPLLSQIAQQTCFLAAFPLILELTVRKSGTT